MSIKVMRQALDVLTEINQLSIGENAISLPGEVDAAMDNLRAAIEHYDQTALELCEECGWKAIIPGDGCLVCARQKPVAWMYDFLNSDNRDEVIRDWMTQDYADITRERGFNVRPLYTAPREWVGLTDEEVKHIADSEWEEAFVRLIEAKLKEKNT